MPPATPGGDAVPEEVAVLAPFVDAGVFGPYEAHLAAAVKRLEPGVTGRSGRGPGRSRPGHPVRPRLRGAGRGGPPGPPDRGVRRARRGRGRRGARCPAVAAGGRVGPVPVRGGHRVGSRRRAGAAAAARLRRSVRLPAALLALRTGGGRRPVGSGRPGPTRARPGVADPGRRSVRAGARRTVRARRSGPGGPAAPGRAPRPRQWRLDHRRRPGHGQDAHRRPRPGRRPPDRRRRRTGAEGGAGRSDRQGGPPDGGSGHCRGGRPESTRGSSTPDWPPGSPGRGR